LEDVTLRAREHWLDHFLIIVNEERHGTTVAACCLDVPLLADLTCLVEQQSAFRGLSYVYFSSQYVLYDNRGDILHHLLPVEFDLVVHSEFPVSFCLHLFHLFQSHFFGLLLGLGFLFYLY